MLIICLMLSTVWTRIIQVRKMNTNHDGILCSETFDTCLEDQECHDQIQRCSNIGYSCLDQQPLIQITNCLRINYPLLSDIDFKTLIIQHMDGQSIKDCTTSKCSGVLKKCASDPDCLQLVTTCAQQTYKNSASGQQSVAYFGKCLQKDPDAAALWDCVKQNCLGGLTSSSSSQLSQSSSQSTSSPSVASSASSASPSTSDTPQGSSTSSTQSTPIQASSSSSEVSSQPTQPAESSSPVESSTSSPQQESSTPQPASNPPTLGFQVFQVGLVKLLNKQNEIL